jgi:hypothetical protein
LFIIGIIETDVGRNAITEKIGGLGGHADWNYIHLGGNNYDLAHTNTELGDEFTSGGLEPSLAEVTAEGTGIAISRQFTLTEDKVLKEIGIFNGIGASEMLARATMNEVFLSNNDKITITFRVYFT